MANKFKQAVEKRNAEIKKENELNVEDDKKESEKELETKDVLNLETKEDVLNMIGKKQNKKYKNKTFYLDEKHIKQIEKVAKQKKMSESKVINDILKYVFEGD